MLQASRALADRRQQAHGHGRNRSAATPLNLPALDPWGLDRRHPPSSALRGKGGANRRFAISPPRRRRHSGLINGPSAARRKRRRAPTRMGCLPVVLCSSRLGGLKTSGPAPVLPLKQPRRIGSELADPPAPEQALGEPPRGLALRYDGTSEPPDVDDRHCQSPLPVGHRRQPRDAADECIPGKRSSGPRRRRVAAGLRYRPDPSVCGLGSARVLLFSRPRGPGYRNGDIAIVRFRPDRTDGPFRVRSRAGVRRREGALPLCHRCDLQDSRVDAPSRDHGLLEPSGSVPSFWDNRLRWVRELRFPNPLERCDIRRARAVC